jgi:hypothetical protein
MIFFGESFNFWLLFSWHQVTGIKRILLEYLVDRVVFQIQRIAMCSLSGHCLDMLLIMNKLDSYIFEDV